VFEDSIFEAKAFTRVGVILVFYSVCRYHISRGTLSSASKSASCIRYGPTYANVAVSGLTINWVTSYTDFSRKSQICLTPTL